MHYFFSVGNLVSLKLVEVMSLEYKYNIHPIISCCDFSTNNSQNTCLVTWPLTWNITFWVKYSIKKSGDCSVRNFQNFHSEKFWNVIQKCQWQKQIRSDYILGMTLIIYPHFRSSATLNLVAFFDCFDTKEIKEKNTYKRKKNLESILEFQKRGKRN